MRCVVCGWKGEWGVHWEYDPGGVMGVPPTPWLPCCPLCDAVMVDNEDHNIKTSDRVEEDDGH